MIQVTSSIDIDESEIREEFIHASGPGGQNVNKVSTAVRLHFDISSSSIPDAVRRRLITLARGRVTDAGILVIDARRFRTQSANREDALQRLIELVREAAVEPKVHHRTKPTRGSKERRLRAKHHRSDTKQLRGAISAIDDK
jgi:ribosome-associated protein